MFRMLVLQALNNLFQTSRWNIKCATGCRSRAFWGSTIEDSIPDATTLWLFREKLAKAGLIEKRLTASTSILRPRATWRVAGMVGAAASTAPHGRLSFSNFGSRIDCYAWGETLQSTGDGWTGNGINTYTPTFGGTSGASPIVTGAAILLQAWAVGMQFSYHPHMLRTRLSDPALNTASANPLIDRIGVMPNLRAIITHEQGATVARTDATAALVGAGGTG